MGDSPVAFFLYFSNAGKAIGPKKKKGEQVTKFAQNRQAMKHADMQKENRKRKACIPHQNVFPCIKKRQRKHSKKKNKGTTLPRISIINGRRDGQRGRQIDFDDFPGPFCKPNIFMRFKYAYFMCSTSTIHSFVSFIPLSEREQCWSGVGWEINSDV